MFICYITSLEMCMHTQYTNKYVYKNVGSEEKACCSACLCVPGVQYLSSFHCTVAHCG